MAEEKSWKPLELVKISAEYLAGKEVPNPRLDAEILLCEVLGLARRVDLYAGFERTVSAKELAGYRELIRRRSAREPVSRILGRREFMGIGFAVTPDVLSPRPETELLVEAIIEAVQPRSPEPEAVALEEESDAEVATESEALMNREMEELLDSYAEDAEDDGEEAPTPAPLSRPVAVPRQAAATGKKKSPAKVSIPALRILDLGTGSGCIAVAAAAHLPGVSVVAVDASQKALAVARKNAEKAGVADRVEFRQGDWFAACRDGERFHIIVSNPPYLVDGDERIWPEVSRYDPPVALYGGRDGLDPYRRIIPDAQEWLEPEGRIFFEVGAGQAGRVAEMLERKRFRAVGIVKDYGGVERLVKAML